MTSCPEAMGWDSWVFWKKQLVEIWDWTKRVDFRSSARRVQLFAAGGARVGWVSEFRADAGRTVSIVKIVSLSPRCEKPKSQEGNKSLVPEPRELSVFRVFFGLCTFHIFVDYGYITIGTYQVEPLWAKVDLRAFAKDPALLILYHQII